ncbi:MAG: YdcF family protein [Micrococcaceae bacterium]
MEQLIHSNVALLFWLETLIIGICLYFSFKTNKVRLLNGMLATALLFSFSMAVTASLFLLDNKFVLHVWFGLALVIFSIITVLAASMGILLLWNAAIVWRRESHSLGNSLTLLLGVYLVFSPFLFKLFEQILPRWLANGILYLSSALFAYFVFWLFNFVMSFLLYLLLRPKYNQKYIIVLGAGLLNGSELSPLLKSRIDVALDFANKQILKNNMAPLLIMSGGQGADETIPESKAMRDYAITTQYPKDLIVEEDQSKNTYQNMVFSKEILNRRGIPLNQGIFATSDYHVFRAAGYARLVGKNIDGIGARTSRYFIWNALLREYVAILMNHKKFHFICLSLIFILTICGVIDTEIRRH